MKKLICSVLPNWVGDLKTSWFCGAALATILAACATTYGPTNVRPLSCDEIQGALSDLNFERKAIGFGSLLGGIGVAVALGPWAAVPVILTPSLRGDRGEFALSVAEVLRGCES